MRSNLGQMNPAIAVLSSRIYLFPPIDAQGSFVLMCDYTGKEVVG